VARRKVVTLLTDFGLKDPYVGVMKGVLLSINPDATPVDLTHEVAPGDVFVAGTTLLEAYPFFPEGSVNVAVVDPGVGGARRPIAFHTDGRFFVGPDNGLFWPILRRGPLPPIFHLNRERFFRHPVSATFHGRDVFAPVAAHLTLGAALEDVGTRITDPRTLPIPEPRKQGSALIGEIIRVDHFGNLITNIHRIDLEDFARGGQLVIRAGKIALQGLRDYYAAVAPGEPLALIGSSNFLEISVNQGRACDLLGPQAGSVGGKVVVEGT